MLFVSFRVATVDMAMKSRAAGQPSTTRSSTNDGSNRINQLKRSITLFGIVFAVFVVSLVPMFIVVFLNSLGVVDSKYIAITVPLGMVNSSANIFIYSIKMKEYRVMLRKILTCKMC